MIEQPPFFPALVFVIGLLVGSFLNVVIFRLPIMMQRGWRKECLEFLRQSPDPESGVVKGGIEAPLAVDEPFNLVFPLSRCPHCRAPIKPYQNIPVLSYLFLKGRCAHCQAAISPRYPMVELFTAVTSAVVAWRFGYAAEALFALLLTWSLITLSFIDVDCQLLPDSITLPMLWLGLFLSLFGLFTDSHASIIGSVAGYGTLWIVYHLFKLATGKEGMGYGDFKLLALLGAWLGWQYLPLIILLSSLVGAILGVATVVLTKRDHSVPIPFGPYLAAAGWLALLWGADLNQFYLESFGF
ncbi:prepilin peptidase [Methylosarcina fibrata]|uniref:prepilin peptidase n=1 Tax=Methylosarcina fibrata TaxID=105972 RepID=UPI000368E5E1|nr:A24 family peptidase [Methylosarcina fibrata]